MGKGLRGQKGRGKGGNSETESWAPDPTSRVGDSESLIGDPESLIGDSKQTPEVREKKVS